METILAARERIESEFDEPLKDVVAGFATMGWSKPLVAEALEVTRGSLSHFAWSRGIRFRHRPMEHREILGRPPRVVRHAGREMTVRQLADELGVGRSAVYKRLGRRAG